MKKNEKEKNTSWLNAWHRYTNSAHVTSNVHKIRNQQLSTTDHYLLPTHHVIAQTSK
jgi:hypothetical protein